jgi:diadenosine tetraphosphate (Ap4A) HIT family hydrolase
MHNYLLWENDELTIGTPKNPHVPYREGPHIIVLPKREVANAWGDVSLSEKTFNVASQACQVMEILQFAPWFNIQANGNWSLLPEARPFFHVHIYGGNKTSSWGKPVILPEAPGTYQNDSMPLSDREKLSNALKTSLVE